MNDRPKRRGLPNPSLAKAMQELRRSSAASPHKNRKKYDRKRDRRRSMNDDQ